MNDYLARQAAKERAIASVAEDMTRQFCLDVLCITMNEEFGFGVGRLDRLTTALSANYNKYRPALEGGQEHEVWQERIDAAHRRILKGKRATCYPGFEHTLEGAEYTADLWTIDGNIITGEGPAAALPYAYSLLALLVSEEKSREVAEGMRYLHLMEARML